MILPFISVTALVASSGDEKHTNPKPLECMAELSVENLELKLHQATDGDDRKTVPLSKLKPVPDKLTWARSFCLYASEIN